MHLVNWLLDHLPFINILAWPGQSIKLKLYKPFKHDRVKDAIFSHDMVILIFSQVSHALPLCEPSKVSFIYQLPAVALVYRLWDLDLPDDGQRVGGHIWEIKFSEDGILFAIIQWKTLEMWKVSSESWSVSSSENKINQPMISMLVSDILQNYITVLKTSK